MSKHVLFVLFSIVCLSLVLLGFRSGDPKESPSAKSTVAALEASSTYSIWICCCGDTCGGSYLTFSNLILDGTSASDSAWIQMLPKNLHFKNMATGPAKAQKVSMPGMMFGKNKAMKHSEK